MNIAYVTSTFPPYSGGIGNTCFYHAKGMALRGHSVTAFTPNYDKKNYGKLSFTIYSLKSILSSGNAAVVPQLIWKLKKFDIVHLHYPFFGGAEYVLLAAILNKTPYIISYHMDVVSNSIWRNVFIKFYNKIFLPLIIKKAKKILIISNGHFQTTLAAKYTKENQLIVLPHGIDTNIFKRTGLKKQQRLKTKLNIKDNDFLLLMVATLDQAHYYKGVNVFINVVHNLVKKKDNVKGIIIGDGDMRQQYEQQAKKMNLNNKVFFLGNKKQEELAEYYSVCDITVFPSRIPESFGLVLLESLACGTPVISIDCPGTRAIIQEDKNGFLFSLHAVDILVNKLEALLEKEAELKKIGELGRQDVRKRFNWLNILEKLEIIYQDAIKEQ